ncbi:MAG: hypothetical protein JWR16_3523 [Nevskia sp.]|nr:hypothetical protein [Nevskia sp.]
MRRINRAENLYGLLLITATAGIATASKAEAAAGVPLGAAFRVDAATGSSGDSPLVARNSVGDFVVVWNGNDGGGTGSHLFARQYFANGTPKRAQFALAATTLAQPALAMDAAGDFVVSWRYNDSAGLHHVAAQQVTAAGVLSGAPIEVATIDGEGAQSVAMDEDGDFIVSWSNIVSTTVPLPISSYSELVLGHSTTRARRYSRNGTTVGLPMLVNLSLTDPVPLIGAYDVTAPSVAMDPDGDFVIAWADRGLLREQVVNARHYGKSGLPLGLAFRVDFPNLPDAELPIVRMAADGSFVIAWSTLHSVGRNSYSGYDVYVKHYSKLGLPRNFGVRASEQVALGGPALALYAAGDIVVAWDNSPSYCCIPSNLMFQLYAADGTARGANTLGTPGDNIGQPAAAADANGNFVLVWNAGDTINARLYSGN